MRAALAAWGLVGALFAGSALADGGWGKNHRLIQDCRKVLFDAEPDRRKYLERELFQYEMSFASNQAPRDRLVHEENLRETCQVVAGNTDRLQHLAKSQSVPRPFQSNPFPRPRERPQAAPERLAEAQAGRVMAPSAGTSRSSWQRPIFEPVEASSVTERWTAPASASGESGLRRLLQIR